MYSMLSKGEVEELIVRPDLEVVTIVLHEGAVIKGKKVRWQCLVDIGFGIRMFLTNKSLTIIETK